MALPFTAICWIMILFFALPGAQKGCQNWYIHTYPIDAQVPPQMVQYRPTLPYWTTHTSCRVGSIAEQKKKGANRISVVTNPTTRLFFAPVRPVKRPLNTISSLLFRTKGGPKTCSPPLSITCVVEPNVLCRKVGKKGAIPAPRAERCAAIASFRMITS
nr:hypothetical protein CFP56_63777 [Quercus suber]